MKSHIVLRFLFAALVALVFAGWLRADSSHARIIRLSLVQGDVRFARDVRGDPLTSDKATWEGATLNLPIRQGYVLATDHGRAEVEFENGAMAFLAENTVLEFYDLSLEDGAKTTRLVLRQGTASFYVNPSSGDYFSVTGGDFTVEAEGRAGFRLDNFDDGSVVDVTKGRVSVLRKDKSTALVKGQSLSMRAGEKDSTDIARLPESDDFDRWVSGREDAVVTATNAGQQYMNSGYYSSGIADLYTYGSWYPIGGYGNCWRPYGVGLGWSPFASGSWFMDPAFGWAFVGSQPWGWLPYHYGGWVFEPGFGWLWSPGLGFGGFNGFVPFRPVTGVFIRSKTGLLGLVPVHPLDAKGKEPINLAKGVFPVAGGAVSQQPVAGAGQSWKVMKTPPRESLTNTAVVASAAPARVSRTIVGGGSAARVVTLDRNSSIAYDAREHRFVNGAPVAQSASAKDEKTTKATVARGSSPVEVKAPAMGVRVPAASARVVAPPSRAMAPPPARASGGVDGSARGGGWGQGASSRGSAAGSPSHSAGASHPAASGGHPH
jgi:FecR protein